MRALMNPIERYASAIRSSDMRSIERTTYSDSDIVGAMGLAAKITPMGVALVRLLAGDSHAAQRVVSRLAQGMVTVAWRQHRRIVRLGQTEPVALHVLGWYRSRACPSCGGRGYEVIDGTPSLSAQPCPACRGSGQRDPLAGVPKPMHDLAEWAIAEIEREQAVAGPIAMRLLAPKL